MADHDTHDHTGVPGCGAPADILDIPTAETDTSLVLAPDGAGGVEWATPTSGASGLLASVRYHPGSDTTIGTTSSGTQGDVDATNAIVTAVVPASGAVLIHMGCAMNMSGASNGFWGIRQGSTNLAGPQLVNSSTSVTFVSRWFKITGLTPGSQSFKAAFSVSGSTMSLYGGPTYGDIELDVWAA